MKMRNKENNAERQEDKTMKKIMNVADLENIAGGGIKEANAYIDELLRKYGVTSTVELNKYVTDEELKHVMWYAAMTASSSSSERMPWSMTSCRVVLDSVLARSARSCAPASSMYPFWTSIWRI